MNFCFDAVGAMIVIDDAPNDIVMLHFVTPYKQICKTVKDIHKGQIRINFMIKKLTNSE